MAKKRKESHGIKRIVEKMKPVYEDIKDQESLAKVKNTHSSNGDDYKYWIIKLIEILEKKGEINKELYNLIVETYPTTKQTLDELVEQANLFTIYENEPSVTNFNYEAYLIKIKEIIEQN